MKKVLYLLLINTIVITIFSVVYAKNIPETSIESDKIISLSSETIETNKEFYLILNLSKISYSKFKIEITNTSSLQAGEITSAVTDLSRNNIVTSFTVDKDSITLDKLGIVYISPAETSKIKFFIKITNLDENIDDYNKKLKTLEIEIEDLENNLIQLKNSLEEIKDIEADEYKNLIKSIEEITLNINSKTQEKNDILDKINNFKQETLSEEITINVEEKEVDNDNSEKDKNPWNEKDPMLLEGIMKDKDLEKETDRSMKKMMEQMNNLEMDLQNANDKISSLTKNVKYQGAQNNYLSSLNISGIELKNSFKKTTTTYFAEIDSSVTSVKVNAIAEDDSSIITVYGNKDLQQGKNKIIINVTAEDGSVRTYKIYVMK